LRGPARVRSGFTLVEGLMALTVSCIMAVVLWELWISGSRSQAYGTWMTKTTSEVRNGLRKLSEDLGHASYPSVVTPIQVTIDDTDPFRVAIFGYVADATAPVRFDLNANTGTRELLNFAVCRADRHLLPDYTTVDGIRIRCILEARRNVLYYRKAKEGAGDDPLSGELFDAPLIRDGDWVELLYKQAPAEAGLSGTLSIRIRARYPFEANRGVEETIVARIPIGPVKAL
jgi:hypothetical protein